ncbi:MAG TPA: O-antigen ligase family protein [Vicinamibacterales bacterium]|nr:O-antigen ligase family protein [Vicinamibacterales bacterium]
MFHTGESGAPKRENHGTERLAFTCAAASGSVRAAHQAGDSAASPAGEPVADEHDRDIVAFRGLLAFTFVLFVRPQDQLPFLQVLHLADLTAIFALVALVGGRLGRGAPVIRLTPELILVLGLGAMMILTAPFSVWPGGAVGVFTDLYSKVILVFLLIVNTVTTRARFERLTQVVVLGTAYIGVRAVIDYARGVNLVEGGRVTGAVGGLFGNPNDMALNMVAFLPLALVLALDRSRPVVRTLALIGAPAIAAAIVFSKSRGGTVGLVVMLAVLLYRLRKIRPGVAGLVVAASLAALPLLPSTFVSRMSSIVNADEDPTGSREARKTLMREGLQAFFENPVLGVGAGQFKNYRPEYREEAWRETHNAVLQVAAELGIGGLLIFGGMIVVGFSGVSTVHRSIRTAWQTGRGQRAGPARGRREWFDLYATGMAASLTGWFVAAMFASVAYYWTLYVVLALAGSLREITLSQATNALPRPVQAEAA